MKFWQVISMVDIHESVILAQKAEELGFEGMSIGDHLVTFKSQYEHYDYSDDGAVLWTTETHWPDPWVQIGAISQVTKTLKFVPQIYVLPMRDPFNVAKAISTAANLTNNRIKLGVGVGWQKSEFNILGQTFENRGKRTDEMLEVIELLMSGKIVEYHGQFYDFEPLQMSPGVSRRVSIYIGGYSAAAYKRAAHNDGWIGGQNTLEELASIIETLKIYRQALGRGMDDFEIMAGIIKPDKDKFKRAEDLGVDTIFKNAWLTERGRASEMSLEEKLIDMEIFADKYDL